MIRVELMDDDSDEKDKGFGADGQDDFIGAAELHFDNAPAGKKWKLDQVGSYCLKLCPSMHHLPCSSLCCLRLEVGGCR